MPADDGVTYKTVKDVPYGGTRSDGKPNINGFAELLHSAGIPIDRIKKVTGSKSVVDICKQFLAGKDVYITTSTAEWTGEDGTTRTYSQVVNFTTKERYEELKAANAHRKGKSAPARSAAAPAGGGANGSGPGAGDNPFDAPASGGSRTTDLL